jgi:hypothetical protein
MEARAIARDASQIAQCKLHIIRQQQIVAEFARNGEAEHARRERAKLLKLLNELDLMEASRRPVEPAA